MTWIEASNHARLHGFIVAHRGIPLIRLPPWLLRALSPWLKVFNKWKRIGPNQDEFLSFDSRTLLPLPSLDLCNVIVGVVSLSLCTMKLMGGMIFAYLVCCFFWSRCRQRLASATPICHLWEWGEPGIFGMWNLGSIFSFSWKVDGFFWFEKWFLSSLLCFVSLFDLQTSKPSPTKGGMKIRTRRGSAVGHWSMTSGRAATTIAIGSSKWPEYPGENAGDL